MEKEESTSSDKIKLEMVKLKKNVKLILFIGAPVLILMPILTTQLNVFFDFTTTETSAIGDTIGGITAPVIGIISALLIYYSFRAQINSNIIIQNQIDQQRKEDAEKKEFNYQMEVYKHLKEVIEKFECIDEGLRGTNITSPTYKGYEALYIVLRHLGNKLQNLFKLGSNYHRFIHSVLSQFDSIIESFQNPKNHNHDIRLPLQLVEFIFYDRFWSQVKNQVCYVREKPDCTHEDILRIYNRLYEIERKLSFIAKAEESKQQGIDIFRGLLN